MTTTTLSQSRGALVSTSTNEFVFFAGGVLSLIPTVQVSDRVDIYNVLSGSWTTATLSLARAGLAATSSSNLVFFAGGGYSLDFTNLKDIESLNFTGNTTNQVDIYNILDGSWSTATLSQPRAFLAATSVGDLVLFAGGVNNESVFDTVDVYNISSNTWTTTTLSQSRAFLASTSVDNRYALFAGGINNKTFSGVVDVFDLLSGKWNTTTLSQPRGYLTATSLGKLAFFGGGYKQNQNLFIVDIFNSTTRTWSTTTLNQARYGFAASSIGDIVVFGGGTPDGNTASPVVDLYNVTSNTWFNVTLSQPRVGLASTSSTNKIFFGGGLSNTGLSNVVDILDFISLSIETPTPISSSQNDSSTNSTTGVVIGIVVGVILLLIGVSVIVLIVILKRKRKDSNSEKVPFRKSGSESSALALISKLSETQSTKSQSQILFNELVVEKEIGEGSYGKVFLGKWNDAPVALKFCRNNVKIEEFIFEVKVMIELPPHPNVVQMFGVSLDGPQPVIVMEYCSGGSLDRLLFREGQIISDETKLELVQGIARGVLHLHKHNIVHRDLAARNILLTASGEPKISDFGTSRILEKADEGKTNSGMGPICWMAPESIAHRNYSKKSDVWSFGIVVYEIVAQREPHKDENVIDVAVSIRDHGLTPKIPENCPEKLRDVMQMCWQKDPNERPNMETICAMLSTRRLTVGY